MSAAHMYKVDECLCTHWHCSHELDYAHTDITHTHLTSAGYLKPGEPSATSSDR